MMIIKVSNYKQPIIKITTTPNPPNKQREG